MSTFDQAMPAGAARPDLFDRERIIAAAGFEKVVFFDYKVSIHGRIPYSGRAKVKSPSCRFAGRSHCRPIRHHLRKRYQQ